MIATVYCFANMNLQLISKIACIKLNVCIFDQCHQIFKLYTQCMDIMLAKMFNLSFDYK